MTFATSFSETALNEKFTPALPKSYSLAKSGLGFSEILQLNLFPMVSFYYH